MTDQAAPAKPADYVGVTRQIVGPGKYWRVSFTRAEACLALFLLYAPNCHPVWKYWSMGLIHLREIPGVRPALKRYREAEYEILVMAMDPREPLPDVDNWVNPHHLDPLDVVEQFHGVSDAGAVCVATQLARAVADGILSPDSDWRAVWPVKIAQLVSAQGLRN